MGTFKQHDIFPRLRNKITILGRLGELVSELIQFRCPQGIVKVKDNEFGQNFGLVVVVVVVLVLVFTREACIPILVVVAGFVVVVGLGQRP